jgi:hypothetical protein
MKIIGPAEKLAIKLEEERKVCEQEIADKAFITTLEIKEDVINDENESSE